MSSDTTRDALRYWLGLMRHEEALAVRPRARKLRHDPTLSATQMASPSPGQDYIKIPFAEAHPFLGHVASSLERAVEGEAAAFFEAWLSGHYRFGGEDGRLEHLVFFPSFLLPRSELAGLLRFPVEIDWRTTNGKRFTVPSHAQRARKQFPAPPSVLKLSAPKPDPDTAPFFVDGKLLRETLRLDVDRLDAFFTTLKGKVPTPTQMLSDVCAMLEAQVVADTEGASDAPAPRGPQTSSPQELLTRLQALSQQRLAQVYSSSARATPRVFDIAVLLDASRNRATFHVQRDIQAALELVEAGELSSTGPLQTYLSPKKTAGHRQPVLGRFGSAGLTESQRRAGELFLGSTLCAIQGPPGTGKTHLILSLAAHQLIEQITALTKTTHPHQQILVVTSTNNQAVDNVIHPLGRDLPPQALPLALRVGSRDIIEKVTAPELDRTRRWLAHQKEPSDDEWTEAKRTFSDLRKSVEQQMAPQFAQQKALDALVAVRYEIAELESEQRRVDGAQAPANSGASSTKQGLEPTLASANAAEVSPQLTSLITRLQALSDLAEADKRSALPVLEQHYKLTVERHVEPLEQQLGVPLPLGLPPKIDSKLKVAQRREAWESAAEVAIGQLIPLLQHVQALQQVQQTNARLSELRVQLAHLEAQQAAASEASATPVDWGTLEPQLVKLFDAAQGLRQCWAKKNKTALIAAVERAIETCKTSRSLRPLLNSTKGPGTWLRRLYPIWGCTLLSLGNNFNPEQDLIEKVVIDEAGQCHAGYAVSALLRASSALIIGDTHQLEPVVDLSEQDEARIMRSLKLGKRAPALLPYRMFEGGDNSAQSVADRVVLERPTLIDHFRCQPEIAAICEQLCHYGLRTHTQPSSCAHLLAELDFPLLHVPIEGQQQRYAGSWANHEEISQTIDWVTRLLHAGLAPGDIGVITPFRGQLELLWRELRSARVPLERPASTDDSEQAALFSGLNSGVALGTVHRFQGGERRVILFTTTTTQTASLRFLNERVNLINVAASRARDHLITLGHTSTLQSGANTRVLVARAKFRKPV